MNKSNQTEDLFEYALRLGDDSLILGHRLSEWCGHGPVLEEDIALGNIALDLIGQANAFLIFAAQLEGAGRSEDDIAFFREATEFKNVSLVEQPNGDFGKTIVRQFLYDSYAYPMYQALCQSSNETLAGIAGKAVKETKYHLRHSAEWLIRLGDGTEESHNRVQHSLDQLWVYTAELFEQDDLSTRLAAQGLAPNLELIKKEWEAFVYDTLKEATLTTPSSNGYMASGSRAGRHTEHLGHLLSEMQILARSYPGASW
jgi:ring-1,2-phenylacetyl-CoA epoxidase subunit PaaC